MLTTMNGVYSVVLMDLSLTGARTQIVNRRGNLAPILPGRELLVSWGAFEAFGSVVWKASGICGIKFDELLDQATLFRTREIHDVFVAQGGAKQLALEAARNWVEGGT